MQDSPNAHVLINNNARQLLFEDVCQRRQIEACGVLLGHIDELGNWHVERVQPLQNIFNSPVYFEFAPEELLAVELEHPDELVGVYHSNPTGFSDYSETVRG